MNQYLKLNNGSQIPLIGYGTYLTPPHRTEYLVDQALDLGYRHIDTAQNYGNEKEVGQAVRNSHIPREEIFVTTKTQTSGYKATKRGIEQSLKRLNIDYIDLILIHWPNFDNFGTYKALEEAYKKGLVKNIGVSNFNSSQLTQLLNRFETRPAVDQIETHPFWQQNKMHQFLTNHNIIHESWSPFGEGMNNIFQNETLNNIGQKYNKNVAQIILRFLIQNNIIVIPKSTNPEHMRSNLEIFDFNLSEEDLNLIHSLDEKNLILGGLHPCMNIRRN